MNKKVAVSAVLAAGALLIGAGILLTAEPEVVSTLAPVDMTTDDTPQQDLGPPGSEAPSVGTLPENSSSFGNSSSLGNSSPPRESAGVQGEDVNSSEDLEQDETKTPEDIDQALKDKETEIDQQIEDGTYTPPTPNPEPTDPVEPPPAAGNSSGEGQTPDPEPPAKDPPPRTDVPSGVDPEVWDLLQDMGITPGTEDGSGSIDGGSIFGN